MLEVYRKSVVANPGREQRQEEKIRLKEKRARARAGGRAPNKGCEKAQED